MPLIPLSTALLATLLRELRHATGTQFCPRCVTALARDLPFESLQARTTARGSL